MKNGKHAATEVPAAMTLDDCWALVEAAEKYRKHCVMMENCNYDRPEMMVFNMVRQGLFGEILHAEGGYLHDLREHQVREPERRSLAPRAGRMKLNGNLYPTHGLGPVANCMDINRGDRFDYLVSMSGPSRGLQDWAQRALSRRRAAAAGEVRARRRQHQPDQDGARPHDLRQHCTNLPRPYSRINLVQGTQGLFQGYPEPRLHRRARPRTPVGGSATLSRAVRASALDGD